MNATVEPTARDVPQIVASQVPEAVSNTNKSVNLDTVNEGLDPTAEEMTVTDSQWERLSGQRDVMIKAMLGVFKWLNGGVFGFTVLAFVIGIWHPDYRIVNGHTLMTLIGSTVVQAGIAFIAITRFLFPAQQPNGQA